MGKSEDITGKTFGRLTVIRMTDRKLDECFVWECKCSCGNPSPVYTTVTRLKNGTKKSCGCLLSESGKRSQPDAVLAAKMSEKSGRFESNVNAKVWTLIAPDGRKYVCRNLNKWARDNMRLFGLDEDENPMKISAGFRAIALSMKGKTKRHVDSYMGWRLDGLPQVPDDSIEEGNKYER